MHIHDPKSSVITVADLEAAGWRSTARGEWTNDFFCPPGGSGLAFSFGQAQLWEAYVQLHLRQEKSGP